MADPDSTPLDSNGQPITWERIYADLVKTQRFDVLAELLVGRMKVANSRLPENRYAYRYD